MDVLDRAFRERLSEIDAYLDLLDAIEKEVQSGPPRIGAHGPVITTEQRRILYSSVYMQLYNIIEATINKCTEAVCDAIAKDNLWLPRDLTKDLRREWVRYLGQTHESLNFDNRLTISVTLVEHVMRTLPVGKMEIEKGGGGNWHDEEIYELAKRLGCDLAISEEANRAVKESMRDKLGAMALIKKLRNDLAHGKVSFGECGDGVTVSQLRDLRNRTAMYLRDVVASFQTFLTDHLYLIPERRPSVVATQ